MSNKINNKVTNFLSNVMTSNNFKKNLVITNCVPTELKADAVMYNTFPQYSRDKERKEKIQKLIKDSKYDVNELFNNIPKFDAPLMNYKTNCNGNDCDPVI